MLSGVSRINAGSTNLGDWLVQARNVVNDSEKPIAILARRGSDVAWFTQISSYDPWHYSVSDGDAHTNIQLASHNPVVGRLMVDGDWFVMTA